MLKLGGGARVDLCARGGRISVLKPSWAGAARAYVARADLAGRLPACLGDWLAGWLVGWLPGWLPGWLANREDLARVGPWRRTVVDAPLQNPREI